MTRSFWQDGQPVQFLYFWDTMIRWWYFLIDCQLQHYACSSRMKWKVIPKWLGHSRVPSNMVSYYEAIAHAEGTLIFTCNILGIQIIHDLIALCDIVITYPQGEIIKYVLSCDACQSLSQDFYTLSKRFSEINFKIWRDFFFVSRTFQRCITLF